MAFHVNDDRLDEFYRQSVIECIRIRNKSYEIARIVEFADAENLSDYCFPGLTPISGKIALFILSHASEEAAESLTQVFEDVSSSISMPVEYLDGDAPIQFEQLVAYFEANGVEARYDDQKAIEFIHTMGSNHNVDYTYSRLAVLYVNDDTAALQTEIIDTSQIAILFEASNTEEIRMLRGAVFFGTGSFSETEITAGSYTVFLYDNVRGVPKESLNKISALFNDADFGENGALVAEVCHTEFEGTYEISDAQMITINIDGSSLKGVLYDDAMGLFRGKSVYFLVRTTP